MAPPIGGAEVKKDNDRKLVGLVITMPGVFNIKVISKRQWLELADEMGVESIEAIKKRWTRFVEASPKLVVLPEGSAPKQTRATVRKSGVKKAKNTGEKGGEVVESEDAVKAKTPRKRATKKRKIDEAEVEEVAEENKGDNSK